MGTRRALLHGNIGESCQMSAISMVAPTRVQAEIREPIQDPAFSLIAPAQQLRPAQPPRT